MESIIVIALETENHRYLGSAIYQTYDWLELGHEEEIGARDEIHGPGQCTQRLECRPVH